MQEREFLATEEPEYQVLGEWLRGDYITDPKSKPPRSMLDCLGYIVLGGLVCSSPFIYDLAERFFRGN